MKFKLERFAIVVNVAAIILWSPLVSGGVPPDISIATHGLVRLPRAAIVTTRRLLVIDDAEDMRELAQFCLELDGRFVVVTTGDATSGLAEARRQRPDGILLDVMMPDVDGVEALAMIRADEVLRSIPVIMLSGVVNGPGAERLHGLDVSGVIGKPFDPATLGEQVTSLLVPR